MSYTLKCKIRNVRVQQHDLSLCRYSVGEKKSSTISKEGWSTISLKYFIEHKPRNMEEYYACLCSSISGSAEIALLLSNSYIGSCRVNYYDGNLYSQSACMLITFFSVGFEIEWRWRYVNIYSQWWMGFVR